MNAQRVMHNFLPQFPGSVVTPQQQQQHFKAAGAAVSATVATKAEEEETAFSDLAAWATSKPAEKKSPFCRLDYSAAAAFPSADMKANSSEPAPEVVASNQSEPIGILPPARYGPVGTDAADEESEPVDLTTRSRDSTPPASGSFTLTDDGRPVPAEKLECPVCGEEFEENNIRDLEFHVDAHLATTRTCPICSQRFDARNEDGFKKHVDDHFTAEEFAMVDPEGSVTFSPREAALQAGSNAFNRLRNFLDFDQHEKY